MTTKLKSDLEKVVARVIVVFSEALRLRSLYNEIVKRAGGATVGCCQDASSWVMEANR